jgi:protein involved in polysaccharide export with SLBB domain
MARIVRFAVTIGGMLLLAVFGAEGQTRADEALLRQELERRGLDGTEVEAAVQAVDEAAPAETGGSQVVVVAPQPEPEPPPPPPEPTPVKRGQLARFGSSLFRLAPETFAPNLYGAIDPDYRIGPGDELVVDVWGEAVFRVERLVNREGNVSLPDVGRVHLQGLSLDEARSRIRGQLSKAHSGFARTPATTFLDVSLQKLRPIKVFLVGEVARPGAYDLSAASTVFHALYFAGGPSATGSMRDIRVMRNDELVASLDVYDYLLHGRKEGDIRLENDDTIFIPVRHGEVAVRGEVTRPARYEFREGETLEDIVRMAGGITARTYLDRAQVDRIVPPAERQPDGDDRLVIDVPLREVLDSERVFPLADLDEIVLLPITDDQRNWVELAGQVVRPGTYELMDGMRLSDLIDRAEGLSGDAFLDRGSLLRTYDDGSRETLTFDLGAAVTGTPEDDVPLHARDQITIFSKWDFLDRAEVVVFGAVRKPGPYELTENLTLGDLLLRAGGLEEYAHALDIEVSRVYPDRPDVHRIAETFAVDVGENFLDDVRTSSFLLNNHDHVFVRRRPFWELQRNVVVEGAVMFPGTYTLRSTTERISDLIARAGGLLDTAYPAAATLERPKDDIGVVSIDLPRALEKPYREEDLVLLHRDVIKIPERPMTIKVGGAVGLPTSLIYRKGRSVGWYIDNAGGYLDTAKKHETKVVYATGRAAKVRRFRKDPPVEPGAQIFVPHRSEEEGVDWGGTIVDITTVVASLATTYLVIDRIAQ